MSGASTNGDDPDDEQDDASPSAVLVTVLSATSAIRAVQASAGPVRQQRNRADHGRNDRHQANVEVADVAQLVRDDTLKLVSRHNIEQAARHRDRCMPGIAAGGKRVRDPCRG